MHSWAQTCYNRLSLGGHHHDEGGILLTLDLACKSMNSCCVLAVAIASLRCCASSRSADHQSASMATSAIVMIERTARRHACQIAPQTHLPSSICADRWHFQSTVIASWTLGLGIVPLGCTSGETIFQLPRYQSACLWQ